MVVGAGSGAAAVGDVGKLGKVRLAQCCSVNVAGGCCGNELDPAGVEWVR